MNQPSRNTRPPSPNCPFTAPSGAVPVTVLLPAAYPGNRRVPRTAERPDAAGLTPTTAAQLVATLTPPGGLVVDLAGGPYLAQAADWFSRRSTIVITDSDQSRRSYSPNDRPLQPSRRAASRTLAAHAADIPGLLERAPGRVSLALAAVSIMGAAALTDGGIDRWMIGLQRALRPDGFCVVAVATREGQADGRTIEAILSAARVAGLVHHQRLVTIDAQTTPTGGTLASGLSPDRQGSKIHSDLLCFTATPSRIYA